MSPGIYATSVLKGIVYDLQMARSRMAPLAEGGDRDIVAIYDGLGEVKKMIEDIVDENRGS